MQTAANADYNKRIRMSKARYNQLCKSAEEGTKLSETLPKAFFFGGLICAVGQIMLHFYQAAGLSRDNAFTAVSLTLILISALLTGLGLYEKIAKQAGAGTLVPITGFANSVAAPALEFKTEGMITGVGAKIFVICGPVILYGTLAAALYGLLVFIFG